jgi:hypothetical protein
MAQRRPPLGIIRLRWVRSDLRRPLLLLLPPPPPGMSSAGQGRLPSPQLPRPPQLAII